MHCSIFSFFPEPLPTMLLFSFSCRSMVPCFPCSLCVYFFLSSIKSFGFLYPLTIVLKRGRNLRIECHSSGEVIDLGGELHVKRKKVFYITNLGRVLVWYTLILIYFLCYVSFGFVTIYIHLVLFLYLMMMYVFHSLSHMCCFFFLFIHMFLI